MAVALAVLGAMACAAAPPPAPPDPRPSPADSEPPPPNEAPSGPVWRPGQPATLPDPDSGSDGEIAEADLSKDEGYGVETVHMSEKAWMANLRADLGRALGVKPEAVMFSPTRQWAAALDGPPEDAAVKGPRRYRIVVADIAGRRKRVFAALRFGKSEEPPKNLRFLDEERLVYEALPAPEESEPEGKAGKTSGKKAKKAGGKSSRRAGGKKAAHNGRKSAKSRKAAAKAAKADEIVVPDFPVRLFVIQPVTGRARPIRCEGTRLMFNPARDRLAYLVGQPSKAYLAVNGKRVYPRRGKTQIGSALAWSEDGTSIAFVEHAKNGPRLVLVAEPSAAEGQAQWPLPADAELEDARVVWRDGNQLLVRRPGGKPVFTTSVGVIGRP